MWVVKRATSLFNSFCSNVAKKVALFVARFTVAEETLTTTHLHKQSTVNFPVTSLSETFKLSTGHKMQTNRFAVSEEIYPLYLWIFKCNLKKKQSKHTKNEWSLQQKRKPEFRLFKFTITYESTDWNDTFAERITPDLNVSIWLKLATARQMSAPL